MTQRTPATVYASMTPSQKALHHNAIAYARQRYARGGFAAGFCSGAVLALVTYIVSVLY